MMNKIAIDFAAKTLTVSESFQKKAGVYGSPEYYQLRQAMNDCPDFTIEVKKSKKKTYKKLTFERMENYIKTQPDSKIRLLEFEYEKTVGKALGDTYPRVKKWFLEHYPEYKGGEVKDDGAAAEVNALLETEDAA